MVGVLTVDDHPIFRRAVAEVIEATPGFASLGEVASGAAALDLLADVHPGLVLIDLRMPGMDGIETARRISAAYPEVVVILISTEDPAGIPTSAACSGAAASVCKERLCPSMLRELWATSRA